MIRRPEDTSNQIRSGCLGELTRMHMRRETRLVVKIRLDFGHLKLKGTRGSAAQLFLVKIRLLVIGFMVADLE